MPYSTAATGSATSPVVTSSGTKPQPLSGAAIKTQVKTQVVLLAGLLFVAIGNSLVIAPEVQNPGSKNPAVLGIALAVSGLITAVGAWAIEMKKFEAPSTTHLPV